MDFVPQMNVVLRQRQSHRSLLLFERYHLLHFAVQQPLLLQRQPPHQYLLPLQCFVKQCRPTQVVQ